MAPHSALAEQTLEYEVKAAFLLNFAKFVEWPAGAFADSGAPLAICILGKDPFGRVIDDLVQGETVSGRKLVVRRISELPAQQACQILFTQESGKDATKTLSALHNVLTVGEGANFVHDGGIIGFVIESRRVRFDISQGAANAAGLKLSSKLLSVARAIEK
ncbi:MAG TPA: YfiR family protein [Bryobacteraceae bacterium]|nr:YfiR family protein [Bryobacteraceae bacterium]